MVNSKNYNHNKAILKWIYYPAFNLITVNESFYDCDLVFELIRFSIQYNLRTESDFTDYLANCQSIELKRKNTSYYSIQVQKIRINSFYLFLIMLSFFVPLVLILTLCLYERKAKY